MKVYILMWNGFINSVYRDREQAFQMRDRLVQDLHIVGSWALSEFQIVEKEVR